MSDAKRAKLEVINGLRGVAILACDLRHHLFGLYFKPGSAAALPAASGPAVYLSYGWIGVQLFFVLSGFVLYLPYAEGRAKLEVRVPMSGNSIGAGRRGCCRSTTSWRCSAWR